MKLSTVLAAAALVTSAIAIPTSAERAAARRAARAARRSGPLKIADSSANAVTGNKSDVEYSSNWSGAVLESPPSGETFQIVVGTFTVPTPSVPSGTSSRSRNTEYAASAWVGIDGDTYQNAILQAGVDFYVTSSGSVSYDSWYEWYPDYAYDFDDFSVSAGDSITITVDATTDTEGTVTLENNTTGDSVSKTLSSSSALGGQNAEWIVEDFEENDSLVPFADFGTVTFTDASATTDEGTVVGLDDATIIDIEQDGEILTTVTIDSDSEVTIEYTG